MRVIGGIYKGRNLTAPEGSDTRPTLGMVKEAVFGKLQFEIPGRSFLDLFSGSGAMGIEALSRGANKVSFNDSSIKAVKLIKKNILSLSVNAEVTSYSYEAALNYHKDGNFDFIYVDPPYALDCIEKILTLSADNSVLAMGGMIIYEHSRERVLSIDDIRYIISDEKKYSSAVISYIKRIE
jgi:16S rRNA (guanine(966)-N(2))-methyltransferase RsmD